MNTYVFKSNVFRVACISLQLLCVTCGSALHAQWVNCGVVPREHSSLVTDQWLPVMSPDGHGGAYVAWSEEDGFESNIYAQRISRDGRLLWGEGGVQVSTGDGTRWQKWAYIQADDADRGVFIVWENYDRAGGVTLQAQKLDSAGHPLWGANGVVSTTKYQCYISTLAVDGNGGVFVGSAGFDSTLTDCYPWIQHFDQDGSRLWGDAGLVLSNRRTFTKAYMFRLCRSSQPGHVIAAWSQAVDSTRTLEQTYAQLLDSDGKALWSPEGVHVTTEPTDTRYYLGILPDIAGGAFITWTYHIFNGQVLQHIDSNGQPRLGAKGLHVTDASGVWDLCTDNAGGIIIGANGWTKGHTYNYFVKHITATDVDSWKDDSSGVIVVPGPSNYSPRGSTICSDGAGGIFHLHQIHGSKWIVAQWLDSNRIRRFGDEETILCQGQEDNKGQLSIIATAPGEAMATWQRQGGPGIGPTNYVAKVDTRGVVAVRPLRAGTAVPLRIAAVYPNPCVEHTQLTFSLGHPGTVHAALLDASGREVLRVHEGAHEAGSFGCGVDRGSLPDGAYVISAYIDNERPVTRLLLLKR